MPVWHETIQRIRDTRPMVVIGVIQEQHPSRCRLFAQWKQLDWPILHDPINLLGLRGVPVLVAIDEFGIVRDTRPSPQTFQDTFLDKVFEAPNHVPQRRPASRPDVDRLTRQAEATDSLEDWRSLGDAMVLWSQSNRMDEAIRVYEKCAQLAPKDATILFRLGVVHRMRYDSEARRGGDFQAAIDYWGEALRRNPNQYIYRRRIQQYGPRLTKPYPFYDWIKQARSEIAERGEVPVRLLVEPSGAEIAHPVRHFEPAEHSASEPDPQGRITRDMERLVEATAVVVPGRVVAGESARVHVTYRLRDRAHWNNEAEPLRVWVNAPNGWSVQRHL
ncbi:MAG: hypothetical protein ACC628_12125, partial [Pirellulaceae bacterium]